MHCDLKRARLRLVPLSPPTPPSSHATFATPILSRHEQQAESSLLPGWMQGKQLDRVPGDMANLVQGVFRCEEEGNGRRGFYELHQVHDDDGGDHRLNRGGTADVAMQGATWKA